MSEPEPTITMDKEEYTRWVRTDVARRVWIRLFAALSAIGIAIGGGVYLVISSTLEDSLVTRVDTKIEAIEARLPGNIAIVLAQRQELISAFVEVAKNNEQVIEELAKGVAKERSVVDEVTERLQAGEAIQEVLFREFRDVVKDSDADLGRRARALNMMIILGEAERAPLQDIIGDDKTRGSELRRIALENYRASGIRREDKAAVAVALEALGTELLNDQVLGNAYISFFSQFEAARHSQQLVTWENDEANTLDSFLGIVLRGLLLMEDDGVVVEAVDLALGDNEPIVATAWDALLGLDAIRSFDASEVRREQIKRIINSAAGETEPEGLPLLLHVDRLFQALEEDDLAEIERLRGVSSDFQNPALDDVYLAVEDDLSYVRDYVENRDAILEYVGVAPVFERMEQPWIDVTTKLLRPEDGDWATVVLPFLHAPARVASEDSSSSLRVVDGLMRSWRDRLERYPLEEGDMLALADDMVDGLVDVPGSLSTASLAITLESAVSMASASAVRAFLSRFLDSYSATPANAIDPATTRALGESMRKDLRGEVPHSHTRALVDQVIRSFANDPVLGEVLLHALGRAVVGGSDPELDASLLVSATVEMLGQNDDDHALALSILSLLSVVPDPAGRIPWALEASNAHLGLSAIEDAVVSQRTFPLLAHLAWIGGLAKSQVLPASTGLNASYVEFDSRESKWFRLNMDDDAEYHLAIRGGQADVTLVARDEETVLLAGQSQEPGSPLAIEGSYTVAVPRLGTRERKTGFLRVAGTGKEGVIGAALVQGPIGQDRDNPVRVLIGENYTVHVKDLWVQYEARPGAIYSIETMNLEDEVDTTITLYLPEDHDEIAFDDDGAGSLASRLWAVGSGKRLVRLSNIRSAGSYEFVIRRSEVDTISVAQPLHRNIDPGSDIWVRFEALPNAVYEIEAIPTQTGGVDTVMELFDENGRLLDRNDDRGQDDRGSRIVFTGESAGDLYVRVFGFETTTGNFDVVIRTQ